MLQAVTVSVNYGDYLSNIVSNKNYFDKWLIVTIETDRETVDVCKKNGIEYCFSKRVNEDGKFYKGRAINDGLSILDIDWTIQLDADTLLLPEIKGILSRGKFETDCLYGLNHRYNKLTGENEDFQLLPGFFQMWHRSHRMFYSEEWWHAGGDDVLMRDSWHQSKWRFLNTYCIHLGPKFVDHKGRKSERCKKEDLLY